MEIIHLILGKANPARMNGVNKVVHELATQQQQAGYAVEVWGFSANPVHDYPARAYTTRLFSASRNPFRVGDSWKQAILERQKTAVVQIHGGFVPRFSGAASFLQQHRIPYLITPHGNYNEYALQRSRWMKRLYFSLFEQRVLKGAAAIHVLGKSEITGLQSLYPNQKSVLIPYGFSAVAEPRPSYASAFIVGFCGRLDIDHKGLDRMLEGFADFQKTRPDALLWLIGDGPHRQKLESMSKQLGLSQNVLFLGSQFGDEKIELLSQCSVFVHASRYEGLPVSVLEAASLGLPCLVSEATNVGEVVRAFDAGYVIGKGTRQQVASGLSRMYGDWQTGQLALLGANARQMVNDTYNWPHQLAAFNQLYQQIWQLH
ncbi:glycosyltransferase family 4 protein [Spirosoma aerophilum]